jgi:deoxyribose-phosphate aldolase
MDDVPSRIEHTVLGPTTTPADVEAVLDDAVSHGMRACVPPCYLADAVEYAPSVEVATVIGFPHGQHTLETKCGAATRAWKDGAAEIDLVPNLGRAAAGDLAAFEAELAEVVAAVPIPVKVILETSLFDGDRLEELCAAAAGTDVDFLKTATGFADGGATVPDVELMSEYAPVKASGGVGSWEFAADLFDAGAERIGASSGDVIVSEYREQA